MSVRTYECQPSGDVRHLFIDSVPTGQSSGVRICPIHGTEAHGYYGRKAGVRAINVEGGTTPSRQSIAPKEDLPTFEELIRQAGEVKVNQT